jgi:hypothetical protein
MVKHYKVTSVDIDFGLGNFEYFTNVLTPHTKEEVDVYRTQFYNELTKELKSDFNKEIKVELYEGSNSLHDTRITVELVEVKSIREADYSTENGHDLVYFKDMAKDDVNEIINKVVGDGEFWNKGEK